MIAHDWKKLTDGQDCSSDGLPDALAFAFGGISTKGYPEGSLAWALMLIGGGTAFKLFVPILAAYISYSIADRPGIAPGIIGGALAINLGGANTIGSSLGKRRNIRGT